jgi:hypothetical protein
VSSARVAVSSIARPMPGSMTPHVLSPVLLCSTTVYGVVEGTDGSALRSAVEGFTDDNNNAETSAQGGGESSTIRGITLGHVVVTAGARRDRGRQPVEGIDRHRPPGPSTTPPGEFNPLISRVRVCSG